MTYKQALEVLGQLKAQPVEMFINYNHFVFSMEAAFCLKYLKHHNKLLTNQTIKLTYNDPFVVNPDDKAAVETVEITEYTDEQKDALWGEHYEKTIQNISNIK